MIREILEVLALNDYYGVSNTVDIAKGKLEIPQNLKQAYEQGKREGHGN